MNGMAAPLSSIESLTGDFILVCFLRPSADRLGTTESTRRYPLVKSLWTMVPGLVTRSDSEALRSKNCYLSRW